MCIRDSRHVVRQRPRARRDDDERRDKLARGGAEVFGHRLVRGLSDARVQLIDSLRLEGEAAVEELIADAAERPHVHGRAEVSHTAHELGCHVERRADRTALDLVGAAVRREAEIAQLDRGAARVDKEH
eukprot:3989516-Prymnesium_polylepis.1